VFYGNRQKRKISDHFSFPFIAKIPRGSAMGRGVFLIRNEEELADYHALTPTAYIQEYMQIDRDVRVIVIGEKVVHAYWRIAPPGEFRSNVAVGGAVSLDPVPEAIINFALEIATACRWDDVGLDICLYNSGLYVLEANMKYGKEGFRKAGVNYLELMEGMIEDGEI
jgi:ribosomal protein S6--L-glutamate ligase